MTIPQLSEERFRNDLRVMLGDAYAQYELAPIEWLLQLYSEVYDHGPNIYEVKKVLEKFEANPKSWWIDDEDIYELYPQSLARARVGFYKTRRKMVRVSEAFENSSEENQVMGPIFGLLLRDKIDDPDYSFDKDDYEILVAPLVENYGRVHDGDKF